MKNDISARHFNQALSVLSAALAAFNASAAEPATEETRNWIDFSLGGNFVNGDRAAFRERTQQPREFFGGVSDFHYEMDVGKKGLFEVDGRDIFDANDYDLRIKLNDPDKGYIITGYREYNTYYDGSGGYAARNGQFFNLWDDEMHVERGKFFFEAGLTLENKPEVRVRYDYDFREGTKDSTVWNETALTGGVGSRKIVPSFLKLDEERHSIALDIAHSISTTRVGVGGRAEFSTLNNGRYMRRSPDETVDRFYTHREGVDTGLYHGRAWTETDITEQWKLTTAYSFTTLDTDTTGFRSIGGAFDADPSPVVLGSFGRPAGASYPAGASAGRQVRDHGFFALEGGSRVDQHVAAINVMWRPTGHVTVVPALRIEGSKQRGGADFEDVEVAQPSGTTRRDVVVEEVINTRRREILDVAESIEARYTGMTNWVYYIRGEWLQGQGDLSENEVFVEDGRNDIFRSTDFTRQTQKYVGGINWYPDRKVATALQYYHRIRENDYDHVVDSTPAPAGGPAGLYPAFIEKQNFDTDDVNFRVTLRPVGQLTFVTRYDFQFSTILSQMGTLPEARSAKSTAHIITESITWSPLTWMYVQASGSYTADRLSTPSNFVVPQVVEVTRNNYWTANGTVGFALSEKDDLTANYAYFLAGNYNPGFIATGVPYEASLEEHTIGLAWVHRFPKRLQLTTSYAFLTSDNETSGGYDNFDAHVLSTSLRWRF